MGMKHWRAQLQLGRGSAVAEPSIGGDNGPALHVSLNLVWPNARAGSYLMVK